MTEKVLCEETKKQLPYQLRGIRDGVLFRFDALQHLPLWQQEQTVTEAAMEKTALLAGLLGKEGTVEIEGASLGETARIRLEQKLCEALNARICVRLGKREKAAKAAETTVHRGTVRGGMHICAGGDLTVIGDVHAGARLEAGGSIAVLGVLSGAAWAGQSGSVDACVAAWRLEASEIRIGERVWQRPGFGFAPAQVPEYACLREGTIEILQYNAKK